MNVFQEMGAAIAKIGSYGQFLKNKKGKVFGYAVLLVTIYFVIANIRGAIGAAVFVGGLEPMIREHVPDFNLENGKFYIEETFELDEDGMLVSLDSNADWVMSMTEAEWRRALVDYDQAAICDQNGVVIKNEGKVQMTAWPKEWNFSREDLIGFLPYVSGAIIVFYLISYPCAIAMYFFSALFVALICMLIASIQKYRFGFGQIYQLTIYGKTLSLLLKGLFKLTGLRMIPVLGSLSGLVFFVLSCVYVCLAMAQIDKQRKVMQMNTAGTSPYIY
ncbi:MAG: DUF1189 domain-containing protein [Lachnospiraceae bacterium]|nr:DUF1189 domain-containing protein [Lachnospiraceae bacterium]